jgi:siderophore synthetase component
MHHRPSIRSASRKYSRQVSGRRNFGRRFQRSFPCPGKHPVRPPLAVPLSPTTQIVCRTVVFPEAPDIALKLSVGIRISSALRTITHFTADFGPRFSRDVVPKLAIDPDILTIEQEVASAICTRDAEGVSLDSDIAKHFTVVIRKQYLPAESESVIICAALLETGHLGLQAGIPVVQHILGLDTQEKRLVFFREYVHSLPSLWPP